MARRGAGGALTAFGFACGMVGLALLRLAPSERDEPAAPRTAPAEVPVTGASPGATTGDDSERPSRWFRSPAPGVASVPPAPTSPPPTTRALPPASPTTIAAKPPEETNEAYRSNVDSLERFERALEGRDYRLLYAVLDHFGHRHQVACRVAHADHEREVGEFGYDPEALAAATDAAMRSWLEREIETRGLAGHAEASVRSGYQLRWRVPDGDAVLARRINEFNQWLGPAFVKEQRRATATYLAPRGFRIDEKSVIGHDYDGLSRRGGRALADCASAIAGEARGGGEREALSLLLALLQEVRYEVPRERWNGRHTLELFVPTEVLVNNHGDCDSKAVTFAALWRRLGRAVIIIELPDHALIGVEARPGPRERFVRLGNRYFVLCEVAGPAKLHPGQRDISGHFEYTLLEAP